MSMMLVSTQIRCDNFKVRTHRNLLLSSRCLNLKRRFPRTQQTLRIVAAGVQEDLQKMRRKISPFYGWVSRYINYQLKTAIVEIRHVFGRGRGLCAMDTIKKKQEILRIPRKLIMTADDAVKESLFGRTMKEQNMSDEAILTTHLTESYYASRSGKYPKGLRWKIYTQCLPRKTACLADWGRQQYVKHLNPKAFNLQPGDSNPFQEILRSNSLIEAGIKELQRVNTELYEPIRKIKDVRKEEIIWDALTMKNIDFSVSQLHSRAINLDFLDNKLGFIPFIDFCNHDTQDFSRLVWDEKRGDIVLLAGRKYHRNEEIRINFYGKTSNRNHFFFHGFVPSTNNDDYYPYELKLDENDPYYEQKVQVLKDLGLPETMEYKIPTKAAIPAPVLQFAQYAVCEPISASQLPQIAQLLLKDNKTLSIQGRNLKYVALPYISRNIYQEFQQLNEVSAGDMNLVKDLKMLPSANLKFSEWVNCSAAALRRSERIILQSNHTFLQMKIEELKAKARGQFL